MYAKSARRLDGRQLLLHPVVPKEVQLSRLEIGRRYNHHHQLRGEGAMTSRNPLHGLPAEAKARLRERAQPRWVAPMLATLTDERFSREGWLFEPKWDGERCLAFRCGSELSLFTRNRIRLNEKYPELTAAFLRQRTDSFIADGEIVTFKDGITSFAKLQERMQVERPSADLLRRVPVWLYLFDLLYLDRYDTRQVPLRFRKQVLRNAFDFQEFVAAHGAVRDAG